MNIIRTLRPRLTQKQALVTGGIFRSNGDTLPKTIVLPRRKYAVPCEP